jgi:hypothetical protein
MTTKKQDKYNNEKQYGQQHRTKTKRKTASGTIHRKTKKTIMISKQRGKSGPAINNSDKNKDNKDRE